MNDIGITIFADMVSATVMRSSRHSKDLLAVSGINVVLRSVTRYTVMGNMSRYPIFRDLSRKSPSSAYLMGMRPKFFVYHIIFLADKYNGRSTSR